MSIARRKIKRSEQTQHQMTLRKAVIKIKISFSKDKDIVQRKRKFFIKLLNQELEKSKIITHQFRVENMSRSQAKVQNA